MVVSNTSSESNVKLIIFMRYEPNHWRTLVNCSIAAVTLYNKANVKISISKFQQTMLLTEVWTKLD